MIGVIVVVRWVVVEEVELDRSFAFLYFSHGAEQLSGIVAILRCVHHVWKRWLEGDACIDIRINASSLRVTTFRGDKDDTIRTSSTIESGSVLQHLHTLDVVGGDVGKHVHKLTTMECTAVELHILLNAIHEDEWLSIGVERVQTADEHGCTTIGNTRALNGMDVTTQLVLNVGINGHIVGVAGVYLLAGCISDGVLIHRIELATQHLHNHHLRWVVVVDGYLLVGIAWRESKESGGEGRDLDGEITFFVRHGCILCIAEHLELHTSEWCTRAHVVHLAMNFHGWIFRHLLFALWTLHSLCLFSLSCFVLSQDRSGERECKCTEHETEALLAEYVVIASHNQFPPFSYSSISTGFRMMAAMRRSRV